MPNFKLFFVRKFPSTSDSWRDNISKAGPGALIIGTVLALAATTGRYACDHIDETLGAVTGVMQGYADFQGDLNRRANQQTVHLPNPVPVQTPQAQNIPPPGGPLDAYFASIEAKGSAMTDNEKECLEDYKKLRALEAVQSDIVQAQLLQLKLCIAGL